VIASLCLNSVLFVLLLALVIHQFRANTKMIGERKHLPPFPLPAVTFGLAFIHHNMLPAMEAVR
jgi:hypothetical protein